MQKDITNLKFGKLTATHLAYRKNRTSHWVCKCDCGNTTIVTLCNLSSNHTKSCGCFRKEEHLKRVTKHGQNKKNKMTPEYRAWRHMKTRCYNAKAPFWRHYGGRGIIVCDRWKNSFVNFFTDMGLRPSPKHSIDRIDNNGDYSPDNCQWSTKKEQARNARSNVFITYKGKTQCFSAWSEELGIIKGTLWSRIHTYKWPIDKAFTTKVLHNNSYSKEGGT